MASRPSQAAQIVDLGGGTGNFTQALAEASRSRHRVLCVDAFAEMLRKVRGAGAAAGKAHGDTGGEQRPKPRQTTLPCACWPPVSSQARHPVHAGLQALAQPLVEPMLLDAVAFAQLPPAEMRYSHVLLKELVSWRALACTLRRGAATRAPGP